VFSCPHTHESEQETDAMTNANTDTANHVAIVMDGEEITGPLLSHALPGASHQDAENNAIDALAECTMVSRDAVLQDIDAGRVWIIVRPINGRA
jgi:hypothetical protein